MTSHVDRDALTLTFVAEFNASQADVWALWADPRRLERWWGPPTWPATFVEHELVPGARTHYYLTGPGGERSHSWWIISTVHAPSGFSFEAGFADAEGEPDGGLPSLSATVTLTSLGEADTRMTVVDRFESVDALERLLEMGMREGMEQAMSQIDLVLGNGAVESGSIAAPGGRVDPAASPALEMRLELVPLPSTDVDRSKRFYTEQVGFILDHDIEPGNGMRIVQLTPPGSSCSIVIGTGISEPTAAPVQGIHLVVDNIEFAQATLRGAGVDLSDIADMGGGVRYAYFSDPDGNSWALQEINR